MPDRIAILTPVLDDWASFEILRDRIVQAFVGADASVEIVVVDDGSAEAQVPAGATVIRLAANVGHQRAIAVGLSVLAKREDIDFVAVMDSDGEDRPEDLPALRRASQQYPTRAVLAQRAKRSERGVFRVGYVLYKFLFRLLTGLTIDFGNFCWLPIQVVRRLVYMPELWNNLPAALMRSRVGLAPVPLPRGVRYAGQSRMNLQSLIVHGLSAMSVYTDVIFVRIIMLACFVGGLTVLGLFGVFILRLFTDMGVPGWASTMVGDLIIILMQTLVMVVATSLVLLAGRSQRPIVPAVDALAFIARMDRAS